MTRNKKSLIFIRDYTEQGKDRLFTWSDGKLSEITAIDLVKDDSEIVCHDYWLIAPSIFKKTKNLPKLVTDIEELRISTSGRRKDRESRESTDISASLIRVVNRDVVRKYLSIFHRTSDFEAGILEVIGEALIKLSDIFEKSARLENEWDRFINIERPISDLMIRSASDGISINSDKLRNHKGRIDFEYYMALKTFSAAYNMPLEIPTDEDVIGHLEPKGYNFSGVNIDYVLKFVPMLDNFAVDLLALMKIAKSRKVLNLIPLSQKKIYPIVDVFGSITSRMYLKDPSLQNLAKRHRDIITADHGETLSYTDFDQYEAGIMGALSDDKELLRLYSGGDLYESASVEIFGNKTRRKEAKRLFLSYAYGMKKKALYDAARAYGADTKSAKKFFNSFSTFEAWKNSIHTEFERTGEVRTSLGNHLKRNGENKLTEQEKRSSVSQVVQGTASLIFKKALLALNKVNGIKIKVPMHDAVLFQHPMEFDAGIVPRIFAQTMTDHFHGKIIGKASNSDFFASCSVPPDQQA